MKLASLNFHDMSSLNIVHLIDAIMPLDIINCLKSVSGKLLGHLIRVLNERVSVNDGGKFSLHDCGRWFSNQFDIVSETHFSCDAVCPELWLAMVSSLLCPQTDWNIRIRKQGYVLILTDFNVPDINQCANSNIFETGKNWIFEIT